MRKYGTRKTTKKNHRKTSNRRRRNKTSRKQQKQQKRQFRGGCGGGVCQPMTGGEDPNMSSDIFNYNISQLPHNVTK
jgi:hypothetical protein